MKPFTTIESVAAYIDEDAIDTDIIFPARFLLLLDKAGLAKHAFHERRHGPDLKQPFILDRAPFSKAQILVARKDFGTGSSREQAVWCLADFGIRCIIAESFGEIFFANCFKNGVLPILKAGDELTAIREAAGEEQTIAIDLVGRTIRFQDGRLMPFDVDDYRRDALLNGLDEIGSILRDDGDDIVRFEERQRRRSPWLHLDRQKLSTFADLGTEKLLD
ncbi:3-isopropylmalate dehydratase small subunit [Allorhizobium pseudoryzae]|uniref:3-isopropylmalate dehydratase small subunit n=1 Tax=Allorhizobium pseudoryzae TaxID=379684 RepID=UPI003D050BA2